jgi:hypothetical protein
MSISVEKKDLKLAKLFDGIYNKKKNIKCRMIDSEFTGYVSGLNSIIQWWIQDGGERSPELQQQCDYLAKAIADKSFETVDQRVQKISKRVWSEDCN